MVFYWSLRDYISLQVSKTVLSILAALINAVVWIVSTRPLIFKSPKTFTNHLGNVPKAPATVGITVTFMFHRFFNSLARSRYLSFFSFSFNFSLSSVGTAKSTILEDLFVCLLLECPIVCLRLGDAFVSQNHRRVYASHSVGQILGCAYSVCSYGQI